MLGLNNESIVDNAFLPAQHYLLDHQRWSMASVVAFERDVRPIRARRLACGIRKSHVPDLEVPCVLRLKLVPLARLLRWSQAGDVGVCGGSSGGLVKLANCEVLQ